MSDLALQLYYNWWRWREAYRVLGVNPDDASLGPLFFTTPMGLPALWWDQDVKLTLEGARPLPPAGK